LIRPPSCRPRGAAANYGGRGRVGSTTVGNRARGTSFDCRTGGRNLGPAAHRRGAMAFDPVWLSRPQCAWLIAWHILLPAFTVGLASYIAVLEGFYFFTGRAVWLRISAFWTRIFAVSFGMGVVSGIIMPFQFGTNWSRFTDAAADVISPMMAYEGLMAF